MGDDTPLKTYVFRPRATPLPPMPPGIKRTRPRDYVEWKTLREWGKLPSWEGLFPGYLLREARENAGLTQKQMSERLGCSQQAVAQAERPNSNPTVAFLLAWAEAVGGELEVSISPHLDPHLGGCEQVEAIPAAAARPSSRWTGKRPTPHSPSTKR